MTSVGLMSAGLGKQDLHTVTGFSSITESQKALIALRSFLSMVVGRHPFVFTLALEVTIPHVVIRDICERALLRRIQKTWLREVDLPVEIAMDCVSTPKKSGAENRTPCTENQPLLLLEVSTEVPN